MNTILIIFRNIAIFVLLISLNSFAWANYIIKVKNNWTKPIVIKTEYQAAHKGLDKTLSVGQEVSSTWIDTGHNDSAVVRAEEEGGSDDKPRCLFVIDTLLGKTWMQRSQGFGNPAPHCVPEFSPNTGTPTFITLTISK